MTVVVVTWNAVDLVSACLHALLQQEVEGGVDVLVVDNASTDGTAAAVGESFPSVRLVTAPRNLGFAGGNDLALQHVSSELVALLNNDAVPEPGWLASLVAHLDALPDRAAVTSKVLLAGSRRVNSAGGAVDDLGRGIDIGFGQPDDGRFDTPREVFYAPGTACLLRTAAVRAAGGFDPRYFLYHEDVDLCWRLRLAGWSVGYEPRAVALHRHGASSGAGQDSELHLFHDHRNRLITLTKDAPAAVGVVAVLRLAATTVRCLARDRRTARVLARVLASYTRLLPGTLAARRAVTRRAARPRTAVARDRARLASA